MKKVLLLLLFICANAAHSQTDNGWEEWQKTSCYENISYRLKYIGKNGERHVWHIQFKNAYPNVISFNYHITDKLQQYNVTTHRKTLSAKQQSGEIEIYTSFEDIYLLVDKVSMTPYPENFVDCD